MVLSFKKLADGQLEIELSIKESTNWSRCKF